MGAKKNNQLESKRRSFLLENYGIHYEAKEQDAKKAVELFNSYKLPMHTYFIQTYPIDTKITFAVEIYAPTNIQNKIKKETELISVFATKE